MRTFLSMQNLYRAMGMAALVTAMSAAWIIRAGIRPDLMLPAAFVLMTFVGGAVSAWGTSAGMAGVVTDRRTFVRGAAAAAALTLIALPIQVYWTDPVIYRALLSSSKPSVVELAFPQTFGGRIALVLWVAGFQAVFLQAAPMSFFARLCNRQYLSVGFCLVFRAYVAARQVTDHGMTEAVPLFLLTNIIAAAAGCVLFARFGLVPSALLAAGLTLHVFVSNPSGSPPSE